MDFFTKSHTHSIEQINSKNDFNNLKKITFLDVFGLLN